MEFITAKITALMAERGLSESRLAEASVTPRMTLRRRLANPDAFTLDELGRVASALGVDRAYLLNEDAA